MFLVCLGAFSGGALAACAPSGDAGCSTDADCPGRGEVCDLATALCVPEDIATDNSIDPAPEEFTGLVVPFFRGRACTTHEVMSGSDIPLTLEPCFHPCVVPQSFQFKHVFSCVGSSCDAFATMWVVADSADGGCPSDAFGRFDESMCVYDTPVEFGISTTSDSGPISGSMRLEIPFLTGDDAEQIAGASNNQSLFEMLVNQYPSDNNRVPGGESISVLPGNEEPPEDCNGSENCDCFDVGF